jgi:hypothetical protein
MLAVQPGQTRLPMQERGDPMKTCLFAILVIPAFFVCGCAMFTAWKTIPPPGGCDQCHTVSISTDWQGTYQAPHLTDERNREYFQSAQSTMAKGSKPSSALDIRKVEELKCFECHKSPNPKHTERSGRYHH